MVIDGRLDRSFGGFEADPIADHSQASVNPCRGSSPTRTR